MTHQKRYEEVKAEELDVRTFSDMMGKLLAHALVGPGQAETVAAACATVASQCRVFAEHQGCSDMDAWDEAVKASTEHMKENAIISRPEGEPPLEDPPDVLDEKSVTTEELCSIVDALQPAVGVLMIVGTSGSAPNVIAGALVQGVGEALRAEAGKKGMDVIDWNRQVANARDRVLLLQVDRRGVAMPQGTVMQKGGDA